MLHENYLETTPPREKKEGQKGREVPDPELLSGLEYDCGENEFTEAE